MPSPLLSKPAFETMEECARLDFRSGNAETRTALKGVSTHLTAMGLHDDCIATVNLVLAEVLNNITEHAYADGAGPINLTVQRIGDRLIFQVLDAGRPMPGNTVPTPPPPDPSPPDNLPEGGFGWYLIHLLTAELTYQRHREQNALTFQIDCASNPEDG